MLDPRIQSKPPATFSALGATDLLPVLRWSAAALAGDSGNTDAGAVVCATMWPTRSLSDRTRWFDELYVWGEGFQATTTQRARIQLAIVDAALRMLEKEQAEHVGVTISFGTAERCLDALTDRLDRHPLVLHRLAVTLRGSLDRIRSRFRLLAFIDLMRSAHIPIGYRVALNRLNQDRRAVEFLRADFAKLAAPASARADSWQDFVLESRVAGILPAAMIVGGIETAAQLQLAQRAGLKFGQGNAVKPAYLPPIDELSLDNQGNPFS